MADDDSSSSSGGGGADPSTSKKADAKRQKVLVGVGIAGLLLTFILVKRSASANTQSTGTSNQWTPAQGYAQDASNSPGYGMTTDSYGNSMDSIDAAVQALQQEVGTLSTTGFTGSTPIAPASTAGSTTTTPTSGGSATATPNDPLAGFLHISNPSQGSTLAASGYDIYADISGTPVEVAQGTKRLAAWNTLPAGTSLYWNPSNKG